MNKHQLLQNTRKHIEQTQTQITKRLREVKSMIGTLERNLNTPNFYSNESADKSAPIADRMKLNNSRQRTEELENLYNSPYFAKCSVRFENENKCKTLYFSKFSYPLKNIYSWVSPAATLRFKKPGNISYDLPNRSKKSGKLHKKDQFMIIDGKIVYMSSESLDYKRTLVHQEHFTGQKRTFLLPEIVEQMEESLDRNHHML